MKSWFVINLGDAMLAYDERDRIAQRLTSAHLSAGSPPQMAAFVRHESAGHLHCELKIYLSPDFEAVTHEVRAKPCDKPSPHDLGLFVGSQKSWPLLFPDHSG